MNNNVTFILRNALLAFISMMETEFFNKRIKTDSQNLRHRYLATMQLLRIIVREILYVFACIDSNIAFLFLFPSFFCCGTLFSNE